MLCLVNISKFVIAAKVFRMAPGERIWVCSYYPTDEHLKADLSIQKHIAKGEVVVRDLNPRSLSAAEAIRAVELQADVQMAQERAARMEQNGQHRRNRKLARSKQIRLRAEERKEREARVEVQTGLDLNALFETTRKEQLQRLRKEKAAADEDRQRDAVEDAATLEAHGDLEVTATPATLPEPTWEEDQALLEETQRLADEEVLEVEPSALEEMAASQAETESEIDAAIEESRGDYKFVREDEPRTLKDLTDDQLRKVLDKCAAPGRDKIKKRDTLLRAVDKLGLTVEDADQILTEAAE